MISEGRAVFGTRPGDVMGPDFHMDMGAMKSSLTPLSRLARSDIGYCGEVYGNLQRQERCRRCWWERAETQGRRWNA
jgi:hypothetical protein